MKSILALCLSLIMITMGLIASFNTVTGAGLGSNINTRERFGTRESDWGEIATVTSTFNIAPGEKYYIYFDNNTKTLEKMALNDPFNDLPAAAQTAVSKVPSWLKQNLTRKFIDIGTAHATTYADLINNPGDNKYIDEIAFTIAYTSAELLTGSELFPDLFRQNVDILYSNDQYIDFADIIEYSDYTTVRYKVNESGTINTYELPRDIYYWYVVHPKISDETPMYIDPDNGNRASPPTGKFWRDYLFNHNDSAYPPDTNTSTVLFPKNATPPLLKDVLSGVNTLWNNTPYQAPSGYNNTGENNQRNFSFGDHAIEKISNWVCKTLPLNVQEEGKRINGDPERSVQPVRIANNHYGNCGELEDLTVAAARTALIPARAVSGRGEDHVWQEFWDREWHHWDNWWSDGGGPVDKPEYIINGKTARAIFNWKGNDYCGEQSKLYSPTVTLNITVLDSNNEPVDGAQVMLANAYSSGLAIAMWNHTDSNGRCIFEVGDGATMIYYVRADSETLGSTPSDLNQVTQIVQGPVAGQTYSYTIILPNAKPTPKPLHNPAVYPSDPINGYKMDVNFEVDYTTTHSFNHWFWLFPQVYFAGAPIWRHYYEPNSPMGIDFFISDSANFTKYSAGEEFEAYEILDSKVSGDASFVLPTDDTWYAILSNEDSIATSKNITVTVELFAAPRIAFVSPSENSEHALDSTITIQGITSGPREISSVEIEIDNNNNWQTAIDTSGSRSNAWYNWKFVWDTEGLTPGIHKIRARASDVNGAYITSINLTLIDVTAPIIDIENPLNNSVFKIGEIISITGPASDNVGVATIELILDGDPEHKEDITTSYQAGKWSYELPTIDLIEGDHTVHVRTFDTSDNNASTIIHFSLLEITAPVVSMTAPRNNSLYQLGALINIKGIATDNKAVSEVLLVIDDDHTVNLTTFLNPYDGSWYYQWDTGSTEIGEGIHKIEVQAYDAVRNFGFTTLNIILDGSPPEASITNPVGLTIFSAGDEILIEGITSDNHGISTLELIFDKGNAQNITDTLIDGEWGYDGWDTEDLKSGVHNITVRVTDRVGYQTLASVEITIDARSPVIDIQEVTDWVQIGYSLKFEGTASDDIEVVVVELIIGDNEPLNITSDYIDGDWSYEWNSTGVTEGELGVAVRVTDIVGKQGTDEITLIIISETTDTDDDGIPDWWEIYFGLNPAKDDADRDKDRDGITNYIEYLGDDGLPGNDDYSDPTDQTSTPSIKSTKSDNEGDFTIVWVISVIVVIIIVLLILFMTIKKKRSEEDEDAEEDVQTKSTTPTVAGTPDTSSPLPKLPFPPMMFPPPFPAPTTQRPPQPLVTKPGYQPPSSGYPPETSQPETPYFQPPSAVTGGQPQLKSSVGEEPTVGLSLPPAGRTADTTEKLDKQDAVSDETVKLLAATTAQSAYDKIELAKEQGLVVKSAEKLLTKSRKALKSKNYDKALEYASKSNDEVGKLIEPDEEEE